MTADVFYQRKEEEYTVCLSSPGRRNEANFSAYELHGQWHVRSYVRLWVAPKNYSYDHDQLLHVSILLMHWIEEASVQRG